MGVGRGKGPAHREQGPRLGGPTCVNTLPGARPTSGGKHCPTKRGWGGIWEFLGG